MFIPCLFGDIKIKKKKTKYANQNSFPKKDYLKKKLPSLCCTL